MKINFRQVTEFAVIALVVMGTIALFLLTPSSINQKNLCEVTQWQHDVVAKKCNPGQKVVFLPDRWGNDQLPILFAAVNCDLKYSVAMNSGGVTCIYNPITPKEERK